MTMKKSTKQKTITAVVTSVLLTGVIASAAVLGGCATNQNNTPATSAAAQAATEAATAAPATAAPATAAPATAAPATAAPAQNNANGSITLDEAADIALKDAGLTASEVTFTKKTLGTDDGVQKYEIEFISGGYEYEYDIAPATGQIIEKSREAAND